MNYTINSTLNFIRFSIIRLSCVTLGICFFLTGCVTEPTRGPVQANSIQEHSVTNELVSINELISIGQINGPVSIQNRRIVLKPDEKILIEQNWIEDKIRNRILPEDEFNIFIEPDGVQVASHTNQDQDSRIIIDAINESVQYINGLFDGTRIRNIDQIALAIGNLSYALENVELNDEGIVALHYFRANAYYQLAVTRYSKDKSVLIKEVEAGLKDYDYVLASKFKDKFPNAGYYAGQVAFNYLQSEERAGFYWLTCAQDSHAGCMNIIATGYFVGQYGLNQNIQESIGYHIRVWETGTRFRCAGSYSSGTLARMAAYLPQYQYGESWEFYLANSIGMTTALSVQFDWADPCGQSSNLLNAYLINLSEGKLRKHYLNNLLSFSESKVDIALAQYFLGDISIEEVEKVSYEQNETISCPTLLTLIEHAKITGQQNVLDRLVPRLFAQQENECAESKIWLSVHGFERQS